MPSNYYDVNFYTENQTRGRPKKEVIWTKKEQTSDELVEFAQHIVNSRHHSVCIIKSIDLLLPSGNKRIVSYTNR